MRSFWMFSAFCCFILTAAASGAIPQKCNQIINYFEVNNNEFNISMTSTFSLSKNDQNQTLVFITDISITSAQKFEFQQICAFRDLFNGYPICGSNLTNPLTFPMVNSTFFLQISVILNGSEQEEDVGITYGLIDEGSFSFFMGEIFSDDKKCAALHANNTLGFTNVTQCCTSLEPIQDISINTPQCTNFKSRTTVYNINDNYSIFFTSKINYTRLGQNIIAHGDLIGPTNYQVMYGANGFDFYEVSQNSMFNLTFPIAYGDSKMLLQMEALNSTEQSSPVLLVGRIIYRNNQTLMEEGIPFTKENDCQYFNRMYTENQVATTAFCCTEFQGDV